MKENSLTQNVSTWLREGVVSAKPGGPAEIYIPATLGWFWVKLTIIFFTCLLDFARQESLLYIPRLPKVINFGLCASLLVDDDSSFSSVKQQNSTEIDQENTSPHVKTSYLRSMEPYVVDTTCAYNTTSFLPWVSVAGPVLCPAGSPDDFGFADVVCALLCVLTPPATSKENPRYFQWLHVVLWLRLSNYLPVKRRSRDKLPAVTWRKVRNG